VWQTWSVARTFGNASNITRSITQSLFQFTIDLMIWTVVVILPFALPVIGLVWIGSRLVRRMGMSVK